MATFLHIAGHGLKRNGSFDPGASGYVSKGEHRYFTQDFFKALKKYQPKNVKAVYHTAYNVYDYANIVNLARQYGNDTIVIEWHFDATGSSSASGGHVIVYANYAPDNLDLKIRDAIKEMVGVRYNHRGHQGISGRSNLANVNRAANGGINYRLVELAFGTNKRDADIMTKEVDKFARVMSEKMYNVQLKPNVPDSSAGYYVVKTGDTLWGIANSYGVTVNNLKSWNKLSNDLIFPGQSLEVRGADTPLPAPKPKPKETPKATPSNGIVKGVWVRVPANKLYATGNASNPVQSRELSAQVDVVNNGWKNPVRLIKNGAYQGFARPQDILGGNQPSASTKNPTPSKSVKVGDTVRTKTLFATGTSTTNTRSTPITGYVDRINKNWRNEIRLKNVKGGYYLGFTRTNDLI